MLQIFIGFLLLFFDLNINGFDLLPDFLGYLLMFIGLGKVAEYSENFAKVRPLVLAMTVVTLIFSIVPWFGGYFDSLVLALLTLVISLSITYLITRGVADLEQYCGRDMGSEKLMRVWRIQVVFTLSTLLLTSVPSAPAVVVGGLMAMVALAAYVVYLVLFNRARKVYEAA